MRTPEEIYADIRAVRSGVSTDTDLESRGRLYRELLETLVYDGAPDWQIAAVADAEYGCHVRLRLQPEQRDCQLCGDWHVVVWGTQVVLCSGEEHVLVCGPVATIDSYGLPAALRYVAAVLGWSARPVGHNVYGAPYIVSGRRALCAVQDGPSRWRFVLDAHLQDEGEGELERDDGHVTCRDQSAGTARAEGLAR